MNDMDYIRKFGKITIKGACKKMKVDCSNLFANRTSKENVKKVREEIESEIAKLYIKKDNNNETDIL